MSMRRFDYRGFSKRANFIEALWRSRRFREAIVSAEKLLAKHPYFVPVLVLRARAIQLLEDDSRYPRLEDAKRSLVLATRIDPTAVNALNELAFYTFAVEDDSETALALFDRSISIGLKYVREAYLGRIKALVDLGKADRYRKSMREVRRLLCEDLGLRELAGEVMGEVRSTTRRPLVSPPRRMRRRGVKSERM